MDGFIFDEIGNLEKDILKLAKEQFPKETQKFVQDEAKKGKEIAKRIAQQELNKKTGKYLKSFKSGKSKLHDKFSHKFFNDAPHGHLIEDGHYDVARGEGKNKGNRKSGAGGTKRKFIEGKKIFVKAQIEMESQFASDVDDFISKLTDEVFKWLQIYTF